MRTQTSSYPDREAVEGLVPAAGEGDRADKAFPDKEPQNATFTLSGLAKAMGRETAAKVGMAGEAGAAVVEPGVMVAHLSA